MPTTSTSTPKTSRARAKARLPYQDAALPIAERVADLLARMTLREKIGQLQCSMEPIDSAIFTQANATGSVTGVLQDRRPEDAAATYNAAQRAIMQASRLGIPLLMHDEAISGLKNFAVTSFPQPIAQAATWNPHLISRMGAAIAAEARPRGIRQILSPTINIVRDPRWGRTHETFGEDPYLTSRFAVAYVRALEEHGLITTPKHFACNQGEAGHNGGAVHYSERLLREVYLPPFQAAITEGGASSIMGAYNTISGVPCTGNHWLLTQVLRGEWGFDGFVTSDYGAVEQLLDVHHVSASQVETAKIALEAGTDLEAPMTVIYGEALYRAVRRGMVAEATLDQAVARLLAAKFKVGLFDDPFGDPEEARATNDCPAHRALSREISRQSIVLLKNRAQTLPLPPSTRSVAVLGPLADTVLLGNYAGWGMKVVTPAEGIAAVAPDCTVRVCRGVEMAPVALPPIAPAHFPGGLACEFFANTVLEGEPVFRRVDENVDVDWGLAAPDAAVPENYFSARWTGTLLAPVSGLHEFSLHADNGARLFLDGVLVLDCWNNPPVNARKASFTLEAGRAYALTVEYFSNTFFSFIHLGWTVEQEAHLAAAVELARQCDVAVVTCGVIEGEGIDRADLELPANQEALISAVAQTGTPTIVVLLTGSVVPMSNWIDAVDAVLVGWYPGEEGGYALAEVLFGAVNPGGKLPITFPRKTSQVPIYYSRLAQGAGGIYSNLPKDPLFPFGFGLSYTTFAYRNLRLSKARIRATGSLRVTCEIENTGTRTGDEVVQLYIHDRVASVVQPPILLKRFTRLTLEPGETRQVTFQLAAKDLAFYNLEMQHVVEPGEFEIMIGSSSAEIQLREMLLVT